GADSKVAFRPTLWTVPGEVSCNSELASAINCADRHKRNDALKQLIKNLAEDYAHPCWEEITRLAELIGHLPLTTLDLWRRFTRSASGMAALAFRYGKLPNGFVSRFENELPFAWEAIPFAVWKKAVRQSFEYCCALFGEELGKTIFEAHAQRRINILTARHGGLSFLLGIASMEFFPETQQQALPLRSFGEDLACSQLFVGENSHLMNLRRIHADDEWAADLDNLLEKKWANPKLSRFFYSENLGFQNAVINAPLLLAAEAATGGSTSWLKDPAKIHLLRTFRSFDPEWFDEAYNWTVVRCLANGLLED
ncbi:MAG TPA: STY4851/ECs_5259 family protein, partial [Pyrinomonadaceae bacterium]